MGSLSRSCVHNCFGSPVRDNYTMSDTLFETIAHSNSAGPRANIERTLSGIMPAPVSQSHADVDDNVVKDGPARQSAPWPGPTPD